MRRMKRILSRVTLLVAIAGCHPSQSTADWEAAQVCRSDYERARTRLDSTVVDGRRPALDRVQATTALTCAAMRQKGWLTSKR